MSKRYSVFIHAQLNFVLTNLCLQTLKSWVANSNVLPVNVLICSGHSYSGKNKSKATALGNFMGK